MPRGKEISDGIRKKSLTFHPPGESYTTLSKTLQLHPSTAREIIYKWRAFSRTVSLPKSWRLSKLSPRNTRRIINDVKPKSHITSRKLQCPEAASGVNVHVSTMRWKLNGHDRHWRTIRRNEKQSRPFKAFRRILGHLEVFWTFIFWKDVSKIELIRCHQSCPVWKKANTVYQAKIPIPTVRLGGGNVQIWGWFSSSRPVRLHII